MTVTFKSFLAAVVLVAVLLSAFGCADNAKVFERQQLYLLDVPRPADLPPATDGANVLKIRRFAISSQFETSELVYRQGDLTYQSDFYNRFFVQPASLVTEKTRQWLADAGLFAHVVDAFSGADFTLMLEGNILALYGDYRRRETPQAVMEIQFTINDARVHDSVVFQKAYLARADMDKQDAAQLVMGFNTCLADILTRFEKDLAALPDQK